MSNKANQSTPPTLGCTRDSRCHQLDAGYPLRAQREPPWGGTGGYVPLRLHPRLGPSGKHPHGGQRFLPLAVHRLRLHEPGDGQPQPSHVPLRGLPVTQQHHQRRRLAHGPRQ